MLTINQESNWQMNQHWNKLFRLVDLQSPSAGQQNILTCDLLSILNTDTYVILAWGLYASLVSGVICVMVWFMWYCCSVHTINFLFASVLARERDRWKENKVAAQSCSYQYCVSLLYRPQFLQWDLGTILLLGGCVNLMGVLGRLGMIASLMARGCAHSSTWPC